MAMHIFVTTSVVVPGLWFFIVYFIYFTLKEWRNGSTEIYIRRDFTVFHTCMDITVDALGIGVFYVVSEMYHWLHDN